MKASAGSHLPLLCHIPETGKQSLDPLNLPSLCTWSPDQFFSEWSKMNRKLQSSVEMGECQDIVYLRLKMWQTTKQETLTTWIPNPTVFIGMEFYQSFQETHTPQAQWGKALFLQDLRFSAFPEWRERELVPENHRGATTPIISVGLKTQGWNGFEQ